MTAPGFPTVGVANLKIYATVKPKAAQGQGVGVKMVYFGVPTVAW
jgi:predicted GNAT family acetyltransferase